MKGPEPSPYYGANPRFSLQSRNVDPSRYQDTCSRPPAAEYFRVPICCSECEEIWKTLILEVDAHHSTRGRGQVSNLRKIVSRIAHPVSLDKKERDPFPGPNYSRSSGSFSSSERNFSRTPSQRGYVPWVGRPHVQRYPSGRLENPSAEEGGYFPSGSHYGILEEKPSGTSLPDKYASSAQYSRPPRRLEIFSSPEEGSIHVGGHRILVEENSSGTEMRTKLEHITEYSRPSSRSERYFPPGRSNYSNGSYHNLEKNSGPAFLHNKWRPISENSQPEIICSPRPTYNRSYGNRPILLEEELGSASPKRKTTSSSLNESSSPSGKAEKLVPDTPLSAKASCSRRESQAHSSGEYDMSRISTESKLQTFNSEINSGGGDHSGLSEGNTLKPTSTQKKSTSSSPGTVSPPQSKLETPPETMSSATSSPIRTGRSRTSLKRSSSRTSTSSTSLSSTTEPVSDILLSSCRSKTLAAETRSLQESGSAISNASQKSLTRTSTQRNSTSSFNEPVLLYSSYSCNLSENGFSDSSDGETVVPNPTYLKPTISNPNYMKRIILPKTEKPTNIS